MKKIAMIMVMLCVTAGAFAQKESLSLTGKIGYQSDYERVGIEVGGRYGIIPNLRVVPSLSFWIPNDNILGFDIDVNLHYAFSIPQTAIDIYPLIGLNMTNNTFTGGKKDLPSYTDWGFNLGFGADYYLSSADYLNFEFKYTFGGWDHAGIMFGYGYKF